MMASFINGKPLMVSGTPGSSWSAGDVVVKGNMPLVAHVDNPPFGTTVIQDALAAGGGFYLMPVDGAIPIGSYVFWNSNTSKITLTEVAGYTTPFGWLIGGAAGNFSDTAPTTSGDLALVLHEPTSFGLAGTGAPKINTNITTVGAGTLTGAGIVGGVITRTGPVAAYTDTTDTAALIIAALPNANIGQSWELTIKNTVPFIQTLAAGVGVTLAGQSVVPPNSVLRALVTYTAAGAVTIRGLEVAGMTAPPLLANTADTTVGAATLTAAAVAGGIITRSGSVAAYTDTTPTADLIIAAMPSAVIGQSFVLEIKNTVNFIETITGGVGVTVSGITKVPPLSVGQFLVTYTAASTMTWVGIGSEPLCNQPPAKFTTDAAGTQTADAGDLTGANFVAWKNTANGAVALTTRTATEMFADIANAQIGTSFVLRVISGGDNTVTLTAGGGVTVTGTATAATGKFRDFVATFTSAAALTFQDIGGN